jgi:hypothetical protein
MLAPYQDVIDRVEQSLSMVNHSEQDAVRRVVELARQLELQPRPNGVLIRGDADADAALRRELNRHFELLGRRGARALPAAALARALLADLRGSARDLEEAVNDCSQKLLMFGL